MCNNGDCNKNNNDCGNDKNNTKNMEKEIKKILRQNRTDMACFIDDVDMDKGYIGIDLYFNPDNNITMGKIIEYLNKILRSEWIDKYDQQYKEIPFRDYINNMNKNDNNINNKNNNDDDDINNDIKNEFGESFIKDIISDNIDQWEKDYQIFLEKGLSIRKLIWNKIKNIFKHKNK